ncbi:hypothetical protein Dimus_039204 [Dionaea muscipula]
MRVPKAYWSDAALIATYLVNRMPSSVLDGKIPVSLLFPTDPLHHLPLRIFGCTCFVHIFDSDFDKLDPRSRRCIFLGYSRTQKGYRCYSPTLRREFVCADVTFYESVPYFPGPLVFATPSEPCPSLVLYPITDFELAPSTEVPLQPSDATSLSFEVPAPSRQAPITPIVYTRRHRPLPPPPASDAPVAPLMDDSVELPISQRKGIHKCTSHPIASYVSYSRLSPQLRHFAASVSGVSAPFTVQ